MAWLCFVHLTLRSLTSYPKLSSLGWCFVFLPSETGRSGEVTDTKNTERGKKGITRSAAARHKRGHSCLDTCVSHMIDWNYATRHYDCKFFRQPRRRLFFRVACVTLLAGQGRGQLSTQTSSFRSFHFVTNIWATESFPTSFPGSLSSRPLERERSGKMRDPGNEVESFPGSLRTKTLGTGLTIGFCGQCIHQLIGNRNVVASATGIPTTTRTTTTTSTTTMVFICTRCMIKA